VIISLSLFCYFISKSELESNDTFEFDNYSLTSSPNNAKLGKQTNLSKQGLVPMKPLIFNLNLEKTQKIKSQARESSSESDFKSEGGNMQFKTEIMENK
jgi:hypothetical protein